VTINQTILKKLLNAKKELNSEAIELIRSFLRSKIHPDGGFVDRSGTADPYYSVFGYTLCYVFDIEIDNSKHKLFLSNWQSQHKVDFVHAISLIRCHYLLEAIRLANSVGKLSAILSKNESLQLILGKRIAHKIRKKHKDLLRIVTNYKSKDDGFNHLAEDAEYASVYANFLVYGLFEDLYFSKPWRVKVSESCKQLQLDNGSFVNHPKSKHGVSSTTAAGIILLFSIRHSIVNSANWLKKQIQQHGGFLAGEDVPVADVLSTATSLLALEIVGKSDKEIKTRAIEFINLHWSDSGGFFGSIADQIPDVEYTFYGLLAIGTQ